MGEPQHIATAIGASSVSGTFRDKQTADHWNFDPGLRRAVGQSGAWALRVPFLGPTPGNRWPIYIISGLFMRAVETFHAFRSIVRSEDGFRQVNIDNSVSKEPVCSNCEGGRPCRPTRCP